MANETFLSFLTKTIGVKPTPGQVVLCKTAFDGEASPDDDLGRAIFGGVVPELTLAQRKTVAWVKGRDVGGSMLSAYRVLHLGLVQRFADLAHGERVYGLLVAPDLRLAGQPLQFIRGACEAVPALKARIVEQDANSITLKRKDGRLVTFERLPATRGGSALRGRTIAAAHFSEYAFFRDSDYAVNDVELYKAVIPRVRGQIILESSPWIESGHLFDLFSTNYGRPTSALAVHTPTLTLRPEKADEVADEYRNDPDTARRERGAEFLSAGTGAFFDANDVNACVDPNVVLPAYAVPGREHFFGMDSAFESDSTTVVGVSRVDGFVYVVAASEMRPTKDAPLSVEDTCAAIAKIVRRYGASSVMGDKHYVRSIVEHLAKHDVTFADAPSGQDGKAETYLHLRELMKARGDEPRRLRLPNDPRLLGQLKAIVSAPQSGGGLKISSPRRRGGHGDVVSALVLAAYRANERPHNDGQKAPTPALGVPFDKRTIGSFGNDDGSGSANFRAAANRFFGDY